jgi:hypothetical protein
MPPFLQLPRSAPAWVRFLLAAQAASAALYALLLIGAPEAIGLALDPDSWWPMGVLSLVTAVACGARAVRRRKRRATWALLALGMLA